MENIVIVVLLLLIRKWPDRMADVIILFYSASIGLFYYFPSNNGFDWFFVHIVIDLVIILICFNWYVVEKNLIYVLYIAVVVGIYLIPECLQLAGVQIKAYKEITLVGCSIEITIVGRHLYGRLHSCYTGISKRVRHFVSSHIWNNSGIQTK